MLKVQPTNVTKRPNLLMTAGIGFTERDEKKELLYGLMGVLQAFLVRSLVIRTIVSPWSDSPRQGLVLLLVPLISSTILFAKDFQAGTIVLSVAARHADCSSRKLDDTPAG